MRVDDALRVAGRPGRVAHAAGIVLVDRDPGEIVVDLGKPALVVDRVLQAAGLHVRAVGEHDEAFDLRQLVLDLLEDRHEGEVGEDHAVAAMVGDPGDLLGEEARVQRVVDRAGAGDAVPGFEVPPAVPGERADAVADADAVLDEALSHLERALADRGVARLVDRPLDRARDHLAIRMVGRGMIDDAVHQKRPVLHQAAHGQFLRLRRLGANSSLRFAEAGYARNASMDAGVLQGGRSPRGPRKSAWARRMRAFARPTARPTGRAAARHPCPPRRFG